MYNPHSPGEGGAFVGVFNDCPPRGIGVCNDYLRQCMRYAAEGSNDLWGEIVIGYSITQVPNEWHPRHSRCQTSQNVRFQRVCIDETCAALMNMTSQVHAEGEGLASVYNPKKCTDPQRIFSQIKY